MLEEAHRITCIPQGKTMSFKCISCGTKNDFTLSEGKETEDMSYSCLKCDRIFRISIIPERRSLRFGHRERPPLHKKDITLLIGEEVGPKGAILESSRGGMSVSIPSSEVEFRTKRTIQASFWLAQAKKHRDNMRICRIEKYPQHDITILGLSYADGQILSPQQRVLKGALKAKEIPKAYPPEKENLFVLLILVAVELAQKLFSRLKKAWR